MSSRRTPLGLALVLAATLGAGVGAAPEPAEEKKPQAVDQYGDPLPPGARARLGSGRFRHGGPVASLVALPGGKTLVSLSGSRVHVWDAATGKELRNFGATSGFNP